MILRANDTTITNYLALIATFRRLKCLYILVFALYKQCVLKINRQTENFRGSRDFAKYRSLMGTQVMRRYNTLINDTKFWTDIKQIFEE